MARIAVWVCVLGLTVTVSGQVAAPAPTVIRAVEIQHVIGHWTVEISAAGQTRLSFWLNTPTYLAKQVAMESSRFTITHRDNGSQVIASPDSRVKVTGFGLGQQADGALVLTNVNGHTLTWEKGFRLEIDDDGTPAWPCCPQQ
jgi:hypothetical protein